ncbi:SWIM zinc finger family protein [Streptomyces sp. NPDC053542]|uniref:SWIM zinc finger family protein n=1 Tax=Streptomyces sp. NPDC053542 TaxID=3365710 RepID=UPI0037CF872E
MSSGEQHEGAAAAGEGLERVRRELERGRAIARAREAAAEASRDGDAEDASGDADTRDGAQRADEAAEPGPGGGSASGAGRRSEAAERARQAVRRTGQGPGRAVRDAEEPGQPAPQPADAAPDNGPSAGAAGDGEDSRSQGAELARQALKRAAGEARRARVRASQKQPVQKQKQSIQKRAPRGEASAAQVSPTQGSPVTEEGVGAASEGAEQGAVRRSAAAERARQAVARAGQEKARPGEVREAEKPTGGKPVGRKSAGRKPVGTKCVGEARASGRAEADERLTSTERSGQGLRSLGDALKGAHRPGEGSTGSTGSAQGGGPEAATRTAGRARVFPAVAAGGGDAAEFAETWWGRAWLDALESTALDTARLARGRDYASGGHVGRITVAPGRISAPVTGSRPYPYRAELRLRPFTDAAWEAFLDGVAARPAHLAALLGRTVPRALAERQDEVGVRLLPGPGDLVPHCSCPDRGHPCKHAAALCFQAARLLDADPFVLLLLRGRGERELLDDLSRRNATHSAHTERAARAALPGVPARAALQVRDLPPLPPPLPLPAHPGRPLVLPTAEDPAIGPAAIELLAADAAARARACLTAAQGTPIPPGDASAGATASPFPARTLWEDAIRLVAAAHPTSGLTASTREIYRGVAEATDRPVSDVARAVAAWRQGGPEGLRLLETTWDPPAGDFDRARSALSVADLPSLRPRHNHLTDAGRGIQLRFGHDGRWYPYESDPGAEDWWPTGRPDADPVGALTPLLATE